MERFVFLLVVATVSLILWVSIVAMIDDDEPPPHRPYPPDPKSKGRRRP